MGKIMGYEDFSQSRKDITKLLAEQQRTNAFLQIIATVAVHYHRKATGKQSTITAAERKAKAMVKSMVNGNSSVASMIDTVP